MDPTDNSYPLIPLLGRRELKLRFLDMIDEEPFKMTDGERAILFNSFTLSFAGVGTGIG